MSEPEDAKPVVESNPEPGRAREPEFDELRYRIRQQEILAELGVLALQGGPVDDLLNAAVRMAAQGLDAQFSKIVRRLPDQSGFVVLAGYGWKENIAGTVVPADTESPAGYAIASGRPVISNHLEYEGRFSTPKLLASHGVRRAINVILQGERAPFGVLEVDSSNPGEFSVHDLAFLQGAANLLGIAIEQRQSEEQLKKLLEHQEALLKEVNHRVRNSLQLVASMLRLQAGSVDDQDLKRHLGDAQARVMAIARAHERLYKTTEITHLDISGYLREVCADLNGGVLRCEGPKGIRIATDRAIPIALLVSELVTNCKKYAYPDRDSGPVWVKVAQVPGDMLHVSVTDEGVGLPEDFDPETARSLGMRLIKSFARRIGATVDFRRLNPGTEVVLVLPREESAQA